MLVPLLAPLGCATQTNDAACSLDFAATVNSGPSEGTELAGTLGLRLGADGALSGTLAQEDGSTIGVVGSQDNHAINLVFSLSEESLIYGVGTSDQPVVDCTGTFGGPFTGPEEGDAGDWIARAFASDGSTPSYQYSYC